MKDGVRQLLQQGNLWRGGQHPRQDYLATGIAPLDSYLPGGGWPHGVTEIFYAQEGMGELSLLLPALGKLMAQGLIVFFVDPPHELHAPALLQRQLTLDKLFILHSQTPRDRLWAMEQCLRHPACGVLLAWPHEQNPKILRRLQLAAGHNRAILFYQGKPQSPCHGSLRLHITGDTQGRWLRLVNSKAGWPKPPLFLPG